MVIADADRRILPWLVDDDAGTDESPRVRRQPADIRRAVELGVRAVEGNARDEVVFQPEHVVGVGELDRGAVGIRAGPLQYRARRIAPPFRKSVIGTPPNVVLTPDPVHSRPARSSSVQGVSFGALPLPTFCRK